MDKLFKHSVNKYSLWFLSKEVETKYDIKIREFSQTQDKIGTISIFAFAGICFLIGSLELYYSLQDVGRFIFQVELINLIVAFLIILFEGLILYLDKFRCIKGALFMIGFFVVCAETDRKSVV